MEKKKIFISDSELKKMTASGKNKIPENALISPLSRDWLDFYDVKNSGESVLRKEMVNIGARLYSLGFAPASDGNISAKLDNDSILITPSGESKGSLKEGELSKIGLDGSHIDGKKPSSEYLLHTAIYAERTDISAIVHAHPPIATAFASCGRDLSEPLTCEMMIMIGKVPLAEYATPGTNEVGDSIKPFIKRHNAILLANHGAVTMGANLEQAFRRMEIIEHFAKVAFAAEILGNKKLIKGAQAKDLEAIRKKLGF